MIKNTTCNICNKELTGKQSKFCSIDCKNQSHQSYEAQRSRAELRKLKLIVLLGNKCSNCGYKKNSSALCFHHLKDKSFGLTSREIANHNWNRILEEVNKCVLLCSNCHMELHHPNCFLGNSTN